MSHIHSVAMLADLSISQWTARKVDKARSAELTDANKANSKSAHVSKKLVLSDELGDIAKLVVQARLSHKELTSPWAENGARILPVAHFRRYEDAMDGFESKFHPLVARFVSVYPEIRDSAAREYSALGMLFNPADYPKAERIAAKFAFRRSIFELPNEADFRVDIGENEIARVRSQITATVNERVSLATVDAFERIRETVTNMVEKLDAFKPDASGKDRGTFRDTLVSNVAAVIDVLPGLNITNDIRVSGLIDGMRHLVEFDAETLRADDHARREISARAKAIVETVSDFMA